MHHRFCLVLAIFLASALGTQGGEIVTRDGQRIRGDVEVTGGRIVLRDARGGSQTFDATQVREVVFEKDASAAPDSGDAAVEHHDKSDGARNVLVEYFADPQLKQRRLQRFENDIMGYWSLREAPDPAIPTQCAVRYTTQLAHPRSEDVTLIFETHGGGRLWVNDQLKVDRWQQASRDVVIVPMKAGAPIRLRAEVLSGSLDYYARLFWKNGTSSDPFIPSKAFLRPADARNAEPVVSIVAPASGKRLVAPKSLELEAQASDSDGKVVSVEFLHGRNVLGAAAAPPFKVRWDQPVAGLHKIVARALDDKGLAGYSTVCEVNISGGGDKGTLPAPWGEQTVVEKRPRHGAIPGSASYADGTFRIRHSGGHILETTDGPHMVYQPVKGDFTIVARLASLTPVGDAQVAPLAGIMVRDSMRFHSRCAGLLVGPQTVSFAHRAEGYSKMSSTDHKLTAPCWLKLVRHANRVRGYCSADGRQWQYMGSDRIELGPEAQVGLAVMSRGDDRPAEAVFENVSIIRGSPALAAAAPGILLKDGTFIAARVSSVRDNQVFYERNGREKLTVPYGEVARLQYQPMLSELADQIPQGQTGVMLASGDFVEGEIKEISYRVIVSSVLFGNRNFHAKGGGDLLAACVRDVQPVQRSCTVLAKDGSVFRATAMALNDKGLKLDVPILGQVELAAQDVIRLRVE